MGQDGVIGEALFRKCFGTPLAEADSVAVAVGYYVELTVFITDGKIGASQAQRSAEECPGPFHTADRQPCDIAGGRAGGGAEPLFRRGSIRGELCTPTGAALLRRFVTKFGPMPVMRPEKTGYGMGTKEFEAANCVRALLGQTDEPAEQIAELCCNLDDMTPEAVGFAMEQLLQDGALDVYTTPIGMKKCRPGVLLTVLCRPEDRERLTQQLLRHTTTLGVRMAQLERRTLRRETRTVHTPDGDVRVKTAIGSGIAREKVEYDDLAQLARKKGCTLSEAEAIVRDAERQAH